MLVISIFRFVCLPTIDLIVWRAPHVSEVLIAELSHVGIHRVVVLEQLFVLLAYLLDCCFLAFFGHGGLLDPNLELVPLHWR